MRNMKYSKRFGVKTWHRDTTAHCFCSGWVSLATMTDKIYQRTKLGESLLSTLEGLWREGKIDAPEAKQIAADFDEVSSPTVLNCTVKHFISKHYGRRWTGKFLRAALRCLFLKCGVSPPAELGITFVYRVCVQRGA